MRWTTYTVEDGLVHNKVSAVIQAHDGAMWFGTDQSVLRFDDTDWTLAGTCRIERIFEASDGSIWAASRNPNEVLRFDPSASSSLRQGSGRQAGQAYGYRRRGGGEWPVGTLWVGTAHNVNRIDLSALPQEETWLSKTDFDKLRVWGRNYRILNLSFCEAKLRALKAVPPLVYLVSLAIA